jgi:DNA-binding winged helix-turn-helix (wHTH) protein
LIYSFCEYLIDTQRRELRRAGVLCPIEPQVFDLLVFLIQNRERVVSKDEVLKAIWHGRIASEGVMSTRMNAVRHAIGDDGVQQRLIRTLRTRGYRFVGDVHEEKAEAVASRIDAASLHKLTWSVKGVPIVIVGTFSNVTGDPTHQSAADGLMEEVIVALSKFGWFLVSRPSSSFVEGLLGSRQPANKLGMQYHLQGILRQSGDRLRLNVSLSERFIGQQIWAE